MLMNNSLAENSSLLVFATSRDVKYLNAVKYVWNKYFSKITIYTEQILTVAHLNLHMNSLKPTHIITTNLNMMKMLMPQLEGTAYNNIGLRVTLSNSTGEKIPLILYPELSVFYKLRAGKFMLDHWIKKLINKDNFCLSKDLFIWDFLTPENFPKVHACFMNAKLIAVDIETGPQHTRVITSVAYTGLFMSRGKIQTHTYVLPVNEKTIEYAIPFMRNMNKLPAAKIMQNGRYDSVYFLRFNAPLSNYLWDTYHMMHCMFPELPKDLAYMSSFFLSDFIYWKDEAKTNLYEYNGKDTHNTLWVWLAQMRYASAHAKYAFNNYTQEFPVIFPAIAGELEGVAVDDVERLRLYKYHRKQKDSVSKQLSNLINIPGFNPASPKQVVNVANCLGELTKYKVKSSDKVDMRNFSEAHPVYERFVNKLQEYRSHATILSNYLAEKTFWNGRLHYALDPAGTETGRLSSKSSSFWCGRSEQNIPPTVKSMYVSDPGWKLFEVDKSQSESWCTGYLSQDKKLLDILHTSPDFHCSNASLFFGIPFEELYDTKTGAKLNKPIRDLTKRTNHGANYNMSESVLLDTMGTKNVRKAQQLLDLPLRFTPLQVCRYLLECFDKAYPTIRDCKTGYYSRLIHEVLTTGKLVGPTRWVRRTFLRPDKNKLDLNTIACHPSQSLSVLLVNKAWVRCLFELQLKKYYGKLRLKAQNHDSIFGQVKDGSEHIVKEIEQYMRIPVKVHGRELVIPGDCGPISEIGGSWLSIKD